jgi:hypothetical protein
LSRSRDGRQRDTEVRNVKMRWIGHQLHEAELGIDPAVPV